MFSYFISSRTRAFQPGIDEVHMLIFKFSQRWLKKHHFVDFAHKTDLFIDKRLQ